MTRAPKPGVDIPLLKHGHADDVIFLPEASKDRQTFLEELEAVKARLPKHRFVINSCSGPYSFMLGFSAALLRGQTNLLPSSPAPREIAKLIHSYPDCYLLEDKDVESFKTPLTIASLGQAATAEANSPPPAAAVPENHTAALIFTSGTSGESLCCPKRWGDLVAGAHLSNRRLGIDKLRGARLIATVPPQHMYGLEMSILLPMVTGLTTYGKKPFFPEDIRLALDRVPPPRILVTTPPHLEICVKAGLKWSDTDLIVSSTAPLSRELASRAENAFGARLMEVYGCTETGAIASRRTVDEKVWHAYDGIEIEDKNRMYRASAPHIATAVNLGDVLRITRPGEFLLLNRQTDLVNVAGKRTSLKRLTNKLREIEGVLDGVYVLPERRTKASGRLIALVVAPDLTETQIRRALAESVDAVFLPRPLFKVDKLPRNAVGKLPRQELLGLIRRLQAQ